MIFGTCLGNDTSDNSWFENPDWSDLTIELSDGRRIPVHKTVLCTRNAYSNAMCGLNSRFAVCQPRYNIDIDESTKRHDRRAVKRISRWRKTIRMSFGLFSAICTGFVPNGTVSIRGNIGRSSPKPRTSTSRRVLSLKQQMQ